MYATWNACVSCWQRIQNSILHNVFGCIYIYRSIRLAVQMHCAAPFCSPPSTSSLPLVCVSLVRSKVLLGALCADAVIIDLNQPVIFFFCEIIFDMNQDMGNIHIYILCMCTQNIFQLVYDTINQLQIL